MPEYQEGYGLVYRYVMRDPSISAESKSIYAYLASFAGSGRTCYPGLDLMLRELSMSKSRFYKHMKALVDAGIVSKKQERNGQRLGRTVYTLIPPQVPGFKETDGCERPCSKESERGEHPNPVIPNSLLSCFEEQNSNRGLNINRELKSNRNIIDAGFSEKVCKLLNEGKRKASSKGRVKAASGEWTLDELIKSGISREEIMAAAMEIAKKGIDHDWYSFARLFKKKR